MPLLSLALDGIHLHVVTYGFLLLLYYVMFVVTFAEGLCSVYAWGHFQVVNLICVLWTLNI